MYFPLPASRTPANVAEHAASLPSPNSRSSRSPSGSPGSSLQKTQPVSPLPVKNGALARKCGLAFVCAECLEIFVGSFIQVVRSPLSSGPALPLSSAPLNLMSSEDTPRLHSVLFSKPIYAWLLNLYISISWSTH